MFDCKCVNRHFINLYFRKFILINLLKETNISIKNPKVKFKMNYTIKIKF